MRYVSHRCRIYDIYQIGKSRLTQELWYPVYISYFRCKAGRKQQKFFWTLNFYVTYGYNHRKYEDFCYVLYHVCIEFLYPHHLRSFSGISYNPTIIRLESSFLITSSSLPYYYLQPKFQVYQTSLYSKHYGFPVVSR